MKDKQPIWKVPFTLQDLNEKSRSTLCEHLGIEFTEIGNDFLSADMPVDFRTIQPAKQLHGGASCALAETVASAAANFCVNQETHICVGLDLNINHIKTVSSGKIKAVTRPLHLGKSTQVWEIKIYNEKKELISAARLTASILRKKKPESK